MDWFGEIVYAVFFEDGQDRIPGGSHLFFVVPDHVFYEWSAIGVSDLGFQKGIFGENINID